MEIVVYIIEAGQPVSLNPLQSGLSFNEESSRSSYQKDAEVSIPFNRVLVSIYEELSEKKILESLNPLQSGLSFNFNKYGDKVVYQAIKSQSPSIGS